jgi:hypothetical protein
VSNKEKVKLLLVLGVLLVVGLLIIWFTAPLLLRELNNMYRYSR